MRYREPKYNSIFDNRDEHLNQARWTLYFLGTSSYVYQTFTYIILYFIQTLAAVSIIKDFREIHNKIGEKHRDFPYASCPDACTDPSVINVTHKGGTFATIDEITLTHRNHPKPIIYFRSHSWCYAYYGFQLLKTQNSTE